MTESVVKRNRSGGREEAVKDKQRESVMERKPERIKRR